MCFRVLRDGFHEKKKKTKKYCHDRFAWKYNPPFSGCIISSYLGLRGFGDSLPTFFNQISLFFQSDISISDEHRPRTTNLHRGLNYAEFHGGLLQMSAAKGYKKNRGVAHEIRPSAHHWPRYLPGVSSICLDRYKSSLFAVATDNCIHEYYPGTCNTEPGFIFDLWSRICGDNRLQSNEKPASERRFRGVV